MYRSPARPLAVLTTAALAVLALAACSGSSSAGATSAAASSPAAAVIPNDPNAVGLIGTGCKSYVAGTPSGPGSIDVMADKPLSDAAAGSPVLKQFSAAISGKLNKGVNLSGTLNGGQYTVFAPVDSAFGKLPAATTAKLRTSTAPLIQLLTYHVLSGQVSPDKITGTHLTVEGAPVTVTGAGNGLKVNGAALICGGVHTVNATVYFIDQVLAPPAAGAPAATASSK